MADYTRVRQLAEAGLSALQMATNASREGLDTQVRERQAARCFLSAAELLEVIQTEKEVVRV